MMNSGKLQADKRRADIIQQFKDHKLTAIEAREAIKKLEAEIRRGKKKITGGN